MNKIILSIGLIVFMSGLVFAQDKKTEIGLKAGVNYSNFILGGDFPADFPAEFNGRIGFHIGGFVNIRIADKFNFKPELLFSSQSAEYVLNLQEFIIIDPNDPFFEQYYNVVIKQNLILVPLMFNFFLAENFDIEIGPQLGFVLNQKLSDNNDEFSFGNEDFDKFEIAINLGVGYNFLKKYRVGLRYNYGLIERGNLKSSVFQLSINYLF